MIELKEHIHENGIGYSLCGDYYIPDWLIPTDKHPIGHYGRMRTEYLRRYRPALYAAFLSDGSLFKHCADIEKQAQQRLEVLTEELAREWGICEDLKSTDPLGWAGMMHQARHCAEESVYKELIFG